MYRLWDIWSSEIGIPHYELISKSPYYPILDIKSYPLYCCQDNKMFIQYATYISMQRSYHISVSTLLLWPCWKIILRFTYCIWDTNCIIITDHMDINQNLMKITNEIPTCIWRNKCILGEDRRVKENNCCFHTWYDKATQVNCQSYGYKRCHHYTNQMALPVFETDRDVVSAMIGDQLLMHGCVKYC